LEFSEPGKLRQLVFSKEKYKVVRLGRHKKLEVELSDNWFSRIHTLFIYDNEKHEWYVQDGIDGKNSTNGTWYD